MLFLNSFDIASLFKQYKYKPVLWRSEKTKYVGYVWQVCPKCNGEKTIPHILQAGTSGLFTRNCPLCEGTGRLNSETGKP